MAPVSPVADYLCELADALAYDPALSRRVRQEVEDHLREAAIAENAESTIAAESQAIMKFGAPREIAVQYRALSLHMRMRKTGLVVLSAILVAFGAMESRVVLYRLTEWSVGGQLKAISDTILPFDRFAFLSAIVIGLAAAIYILSRPTPAIHRPPCRTQIRWGQLLMAIAIGATALAAACEAILTSWRLATAHWTAVSAFPVASIVLEVSIAFAAIFYIRDTIRRSSAILGNKDGASDSFRPH